MQRCRHYVLRFTFYVLRIMRRPMDLTSIPIIDHHCHAVRRFDHPLAADEFRAFFAETTDPEMPGHIARTVFYMRMVRDVAAALGCEPSEEGLLEARNG